jgi:hypothetical protein
MFSVQILSIQPQKTLQKTGTKLHITLALSALSYGSENWTVKPRDTRRITAEDMKYFRITARYTLDRSYNKYIVCKRIKHNLQFWTKYMTAEEIGCNM